MKGSLFWMTGDLGRFSMSCLMFTLYTAKSSASWNIESGTGKIHTITQKILKTLVQTQLKWDVLLHHYLLFETKNQQLNLSLLREEWQRIADIFLSRKAEFLVFTTYIGHYDRSMSLLENSCQTSPAFAAIVQKFEVRNQTHIYFIWQKCVCQKKKKKKYVGKWVFMFSSEDLHL